MKLRVAIPSLILRSMLMIPAVIGIMGIIYNSLILSFSFLLYLFVLPFVVIDPDDNLITIWIPSYMYSKYGIIYYRIIKRKNNVKVRIYKNNYLFYVKIKDSEYFKLRGDTEKDMNTIKDYVLETHENVYKKKKKKMLMANNIKVVKSRLSKQAVNIHSDDTKFIEELKEL